MSIAALTTIVLLVLLTAYALYGRIVSRILDLRQDRPTPAREINDGIDFVPTHWSYLLGQHFSAISAAGPIAGPILACQQFGWLPSILWIVLGVVFIGAVHDFTATVASVRHGAGSIVEIVRRRIGPRAARMLMAFIWVSIVYVIVAFTDITAGTFVGSTQEFPLEGVTFNAGGAVALAGILYLLLSILMGIVQRRWNPSLLRLTLLFVPMTFLLVWLSTRMSQILVLSVENPVRLWGFAILLYCFVASLAPVWLLLQPRGYLGGFVLFFSLVVGIFGIYFGDYEISQDAFKGWSTTSAGGSSMPLFPFLFVTIACGACSGFHGLVCSGTTSKQIAREKDCRLVGYGAMLLEALVALIALVTIMVLTQEQARNLTPGAIYGQGIGSFLTLALGEERRLFAVTFGAMAFSTFVFDTLDVATRLGRYLVQELFNLRGVRGRVFATALTLLPAWLFIASAEKGSYLQFWTLFGSSNQLLAGLTLAAITVWLYRTRKPLWITLAPAIFVLTVTLSALAIQFAGFFRTVLAEGMPAAGPSGINALLVLALGLMTGLFGREVYRVVISSTVSPADDPAQNLSASAQIPARVPDSGALAPGESK